MTTGPRKEHEWLNRLVGEWTSVTEAVMEPGQPPQQFRGSETVRSLGGYWVILEGTGEGGGGGTSNTVMTLGYDPDKGHYLGTFIGSMGSHMWLYAGSREEGGGILTLNTEGPDLEVEGKTSKYRDVIEIKSDDERTLSSYMLKDDGTWQEVMIMRFQRKR